MIALAHLINWLKGSVFVPLNAAKSAVVALDDLTFLPGSVLHYYCSWLYAENLIIYI